MVRRCPKGIGAPVFDKLEAELAKALMSLPATKVLALLTALNLNVAFFDKLEAELGKALMLLLGTKVPALLTAAYI